MWVLIPVSILIIILFILIYPISYKININNEYIYVKISYLFGIFTKEYEKNFLDEDEKENNKSKEYVKEHIYDKEKDKEEIKDNIKNKDSIKKSENIETKKEKFESNVDKENTKTNVENAKKKREITFIQKLRFAIRNGTFKIIIKALKKLYDISKPSKFDISGRIGLGDPSQTGILVGILYATFTDIALAIDWEYIEKIFELKVDCKGSIIPLKALWIIVKTVISKPVREFLSYIRGKTDE